jgi:surfactin synthase thioesterase subunit
MNGFNLFCLSYAGGSRYSYRIFEKNAPPGLCIRPLEYPGRGARSNELPAGEINLLVEDLYQQIAGELHSAPYAIYGHSLGAILAFLLARRLARSGDPLPLQLFLSGCEGPSVIKREVERHLLGKEDFVEELKRLKGCPDEILENEELFGYFEPIIRADFKLADTYLHEAGPPLDIPFTVITGSDEDMTDEDISAWQQESSYEVDFLRMPGDHFFLFDHSSRILSLILHKLNTAFYH